LGFMFAALGVGAVSSGVFHVATHAFFKALLFLGAGSVIHAMHHEQDVRNMGGLRSKLPITHATFLLGFLAIIGFPFFSGYFSKDEIIIKALETKPIIGYLLIVGALMTSFYMARLYFLTFWGKFRGTHEQEHHLHESPLSMTVPLMVLAVLSVAGGFLLEPYIHHNLIPSLAEKAGGHGDNHTLHTIMYGVTAAALAVAGFAYTRYAKADVAIPTDEEMAGFGKTVYNKYYVDEIYNSLITKPLDAVSRFFSSVFDPKIVDGIINSTGAGTSWLSSVLRRTQAGSVGVYFFAMVVSIILILALKVL
jgi:NADH-quinone oxidoreductase subunit L